MSQWGQAQPGYQYPLQTGFPAVNPQLQPQNPQFQPPNPQFQPPNPQLQPQNATFQQGSFGIGGLVSQPTGFPGQQFQGLQQPPPPQVGLSGGSGFLQAQPTGFPAQAGNFQTRPAPPPVPRLPVVQPPQVPPIPPQFQNANQGPGLIGVPAAGHFLSASPGLSGPGLTSQPTGFAGRPAGAPIVPQVTGYIDPRLQMMTTTFMPVNASAFGSGAPPQLPPPQYNLQQSFQQHNLTHRGTATPQMSWALSKAEKKQYNNIFRSWDAQRTGFLSGQIASEVFKVSGLSKEELAQIWYISRLFWCGRCLTYALGISLISMIVANST